MEEKRDCRLRPGSKKAGSEALTNAAIAYMKQHCTDKFSLQEMADALFVNGSYLLRTFKQHTGHTPLAYHHMIRCEYAKELLVSTDQSISEVGEAVGFVSSAHFAHVFKKTVGVTPTEYRNAHAAREIEPGGN